MRIRRDEQPAGVGGEGGHEAGGACQLPGLVGDGQLQLAGERRGVGGGDAEQAAERGEAGAFEIVEPVLERLAGGEGAGGGREAIDLGAEGGEAGGGAVERGRRAIPAGAGGGGAPAEIPFGLSSSKPSRSFGAGKGGMPFDRRRANGEAGASAQCAGRAPDQAAAAAAVSRRTILRLENEQRDIQPDKVAAIRRAFEAAGVRFLDEGADAGGVVPPKLRSLPSTT